MKRSTLLETAKIMLACFLGGAVFVAIALLVAPVLWWLAALGGAATGYLSSDFRKVLRAVPVAAGKAQLKVPAAWKVVAEVIGDWLRAPHPVFYPALGLALIAWMGFVFGFSFLLPAKYSGAIHDPLWTIFSVEFLVMALGCTFIPLSGLARLGAAIEKHYFVPYGASAEKMRERDEAKGLTEAAFTYANAYRWIKLGAREKTRRAIASSRDSVLRWLENVKAVGAFVFYLFRLIHSHKRLLCAVDGVLGGIFVALYFRRSGIVLTWPAYLLAVLFGGLAGSGLGPLNWHIISVRILHVQEVKVQADQA
jgi:hypothetical protein